MELQRRKSDLPMNNYDDDGDEGGLLLWLVCGLFFWVVVGIVIYSQS